MRWRSVAAVVGMSTAVLVAAGPPATAGATTCVVSQLAGGQGNAGPAAIDDTSHVVVADTGDPVGTNPDHNSEIFLRDVSTGSVTQLTSTTSGNSGGSVAISGDGSRVAFLSTTDLTGGNSDHNAEVFVWTGSAFRQVTATTGSGSTSRFSMDQTGSRLTFISSHDLLGQNPAHAQAVYWWDAGGGGTLHQLPFGDGVHSFAEPSMSDAGTRIAYLDDHSLPTGFAIDLVLHDTALPSTTNQTNLTDAQSGNVRGGTGIDQTGHLAAFAAQVDPLGTNADLNQELFLIDLDSHAVTQLTTSTGPSNVPFSLADDGRTVAMTTARDLIGDNPDLDPALFRRHADGSVEQIVATPLLGGARISGDGERITFVSGNNLTGQNPGELDAVFLADCSGDTPLPAPPRPDALIRKGGREAFRGGNVYNTTGANQTRAVVAARNTTTAFAVRIQNDRTQSDSFRVQGPAGNTANFRVRYFAGATEITAAVAAGTYRVNGLAAGASRTITMKVTVKRAAPRNASISRLVTVRSVADATVRDAVKATVRRT
jgi:Tol biopolymer transport system component